MSFNDQKYVKMASISWKLPLEKFAQNAKIGSHVFNNFQTFLKNFFQQAIYICFRSLYEVLNTNIFTPKLTNLKTATIYCTFSWTGMLILGWNEFRSLWMIKLIEHEVPNLRQNKQIPSQLPKNSKWVPKLNSCALAENMFLQNFCAP